MTSAQRRRGPVVAVTGAASGIGSAFLAHATTSGDFRRVVAIDDHRGESTGATWRIIDVTDPLLANRISDVDVLVHLAFDHTLGSDGRKRRAFNLRSAQTVLTACAAARVRRVILVTSAMVYGAAPGNPVPLPEEAPLAAEPDGGIVGDYLEIERLVAQSHRSHPGLSVTVLRPAALVGPYVDTVVTRHFEAPRLLMVKGCVPQWQFCHVDDLASALVLAAVGRVSGNLAVGADGWIPHDEVAEVSGLRRLELPAGLTFGTAQRLHRLGITPAPATDLHYVVYPWVVDCTALRSAGWKAAWSNADALRELLSSRGGHAVAGRRIGGKEATVAATAAGATVAVISTAAIVRRARRKRRS